METGNSCRLNKHSKLRHLEQWTWSGQKERSDMKCDRDTVTTAKYIKSIGILNVLQL